VHLLKSMLAGVLSVDPVCLAYLLAMLAAVLVFKIREKIRGES